MSPPPTSITSPSTCAFSEHSVPPSAARRFSPSAPRRMFIRSGPSVPRLNHRFFSGQEIREPP